MPWYAQKGPSGQPGALKKSASSPGSDWVEIPGATDSMTQRQAMDQLTQDVLHGAFGTASPFSSGQPLQNLNPLAPFSSIQNALSAFYRKVTDGKMWRSLGWILLGVLLMIMGIALYLRKTIGGTLASLATSGVA